MASKAPAPSTYSDSVLIHLLYEHAHNCVLEGCDKTASLFTQAALRLIDTTSEIERLRSILTKIEDAWVVNDATGDDYDEGFDDALKHCHGIALTMHESTSA